RPRRGPAGDTRAPLFTPPGGACDTPPAVISATAPRRDAAKLRRPGRRSADEGETLAADRKGPRNEPYVAILRVTAWPLRDRCPCDVAIGLCDRGFLLPSDARPSGFACFRRLPPRDAGHVRRDTSLWDDGKQHFALFQVTVRHIRDRRLCRLHIVVRHRVLLLRPDAWSSGLASFRRLSARDAGHAHRDTCLWNAVKQLASRLHELGPLR